MIRRALALLLLLPTLASADYASVVLADSPAYYWHLGETSGTTATNSGSQAPLGDGTYTGGYTLNQAGIPGYAATNGAVAVNGSTGYVSAADTGGKMTFPHGNGDTFSAEIWCYASSSVGVGAVFSNGVTGSPARYAWNLYCNSSTGVETWTIHNTSGSPTCQGGNYGTISSASSSCALNSWCHLVGTTSATTGNALTRQSFYLNASLVSTITSFSGSMCVTTFDNIDMGRRSDAAVYWTGRIDEPAIYYSIGNSLGELTQTQVTAHYNAGMGIGGGIIQRRIFQSRLPRLPSFRDGDYFERAAQYGYATGIFPPSEKIPSVIPIGYLPFDVAPPGNIGRAKHLSAGPSQRWHGTPFEAKARVLGLLGRP